jgi:hypothetical protein
MKTLRRHLNYANVVATFALLFAMSGGALAANHYLVNSTRQINPKVLKKLKGNAGKVGRVGRTGLTGSAGPAGATGAAGAKGAEGAKGIDGANPLAALPSGQQESGDYGIGTPDTGTSGSGFLSQSVSFPIALAARIPASNVEFVDENHTSGPNCSGVGHANPGFLCIYEQESVDIAATPAALIVEYEDHGPHDGSGNFGFTIKVPVSGPNALEYGTFTVSAP